ncbi:formate-tetrahydrofolate ligase [Rhodothalassium salexigens DSM 2132]|uniref:Formate--tetrahydrofolate ligase n=1 Tax=Rhodothalassium salexigens DSM 2132 TaxID=1188247 RepID=A0A4R2PW63_RHOSA|nr:formate--tetrahydrofolate ligase [Rhodothalassium salexigens]MBB4210311.1 formate--tetrahydrofolate ligase [Rhodothalassium salexigens DSM 2132]MBK1639220.1 formate--tetrahydrofolate ligase [Rhodothalassium salexigens DSM 2132]TCP38475.1 formate-tetrahydrofolate ligase [Rhodothalassium salexigens DSM 2132]
MSHPSDIEIARNAHKKPIAEVAARLGLRPDQVLPYGHDKAKLGAGALAARRAGGGQRGRLILVTAINPTPAGEGKTTTTVGLGDGLNAIGKNAAICLREPSLGPCFGMKGGATGGGRAQVVPMDAINLHFTGDFHAISAAHNLLAAMIDNHLHWGNALDLDPRRITWRRVLDMNDRSLRQVATGLGGAANGFVRETGFDITVASEVMAILCLAEDLDDLERRLGAIIVGYRRDQSPVFARDLKADGAMAALLKEAMQPNLVQTIENNPALVHGGPFANIAHGCNSVIATKAALSMADYVVTEAGFGADLGAEKFLNIKCRQAGLAPDAVVLVASIRALKMNGGVAKGDLGVENVAAVEAGCANLGRHMENIAKFGLPVVVGLNRFATDTDAEADAVIAYCEARGVPAFLNTHWAEGSAGIRAMAEHVAALADQGAANFTPLYADDLGLQAKIERVAREIYRADGVALAPRVARQLADWEAQGHGRLPVCIAKTQYSFSADPGRLGAPTGHTLPVREVRLAAGAGFVVALAGDIMTMPGLPRQPAAEAITLTDAGEIDGLF